MRLSSASTETVSVVWATANGTAHNGSDYVAGFGAVTFTPGQTAKSIVVSVKGDNAVEPNETFLVNLAAPTNATIGDGQGQGTIVNDDGGCG